MVTFFSQESHPGAEHGKAMLSRSACIRRRRSFQLRINSRGMGRSAHIRRHGVTELSIEKWKAFLQLKKQFDHKCGCSIYSLLPGVLENSSVDLV